MPQYNKADLGRVAMQYGFTRDTFEKVLRLKEILVYFNTQEYLVRHLVLKGGTAINLTVFNMPRLSVDIDMDYTPNDSRGDMLKFYYNYINAGGNKDMIKIELNYSLRTHIFEPVYQDILNEVFKSDIKIRTVEPIEIFAAKGNALISRAAARDLYDWGNLIEEGLFKNQRDLFRKSFAFYTTISADKDQINYSFDTSAIDSLDFAKIRRDLFPVISKKDNFQLEKRKKHAKQYISDLMQLTEKETEYMDRFMARDYHPELLFEDEEIVERLIYHPMALWKCKQ